MRKTEEEMKILIGYKCDDFKKYLQGKDNSYPMNLLNEAWAMHIHGQTLRRLNERGGLSARETMMNVFKLEWDTVKLLTEITAYDIIMSHKQAMQTFAQQDKWIKIEDEGKLPKPDPKDPVRSIRCLLTNGKSEMSFGYYNFIRMLWFWENMYMDHITHWQPLPTPPNSTPST